MGVQSIGAQSLDLLYAKAGLWWLFTFVRHCASCVWNDICDRDLDRLVGMSIRDYRHNLRLGGKANNWYAHSVERTKNRPLASGRMSLLGASSLLSVLLVLTLWLLKVASGDTTMYVVSIL